MLSRRPLSLLPLLPAIVASAACDPIEEERGDHVLEGDGGSIRVDVWEEPFRFEIRDASGRVVLASRGDGEGEGYGALGFASGSVEWGFTVSPGYTGATPTFDAWSDGWRVASTETTDDTLTLELRPIDGNASPIELIITARHAAVRFEARSTDGSPRFFGAAFESPDDEGFIGLGERYTHTNLRGTDMYNWAQEGGIGGPEGDSTPGPSNPAPNGEAQTYYPVPFMVSTRGYGFWLDSTWYSMFNLATEREQAWRTWHIGPELAFEVYTDDPDTPEPFTFDAIDAFTAKTGRPMVPPDWTYGPRRRIGRNSEVDGTPEIQAMRDDDLAITAVDDALHFLPLGRHVGKDDELSAWVDSAADLGYRVNGYYNSYLALDPSNDASSIPEVRQEGIDNGYFLTDASGELSVAWLISGVRVDILAVDFTNPDAVSWYHDMLQWAVDLGYAGWMYDFGEYTLPEAVGFDGRTGEELHNAYPVLYDRAVFEFFEPGPHAGDWLAFARSGFTGSSQYIPMVWSGDPAASFESTDGLPSMVRAGINLGVSGVPHFGGDINGFHCLIDGYETTDEERLARWIQQGSMTPNMMDQNACLGALGEGRKANIWDDPLAREAWRTYARLHTRMLPYVRALSEQAHANGRPIIRSLFLEHPDDPAWVDVDDAYYYGPALYVAPVVMRGQTIKEVILPEGYYFDWQDQRLVVGLGADDTVELDAPLAKLPLLLRDGGVLPLLDPSIDTLAEESHPDVVGPADVADVYDVVGFVSPEVGSGRIELADGSAMFVNWTGDFEAPFGFDEVDEDTLASCDGCYRVDELADGVQRIRISATSPSLAAGGLAVEHSTERRIRCDLYVLTE